ncbi:MAG: AbrB family transcriptional regulator [Hydrocarboniphaga sp.]|uniref:AbrB/MazE/SpoVT family DNA-binding domain-containing protein n=1 Tax=Hydrocarboniphaga sp. TaxID=2033016 RepID=UPI00262B363A|nr:AbrB/MazE/SpoVT family DNA-binding domain-containing protein [Hydrocarboniphaga sp.]MDB5967816.1 AbrB family transcriptional regulator [Hydrocarboniphaga sp.]
MQIAKWGNSLAVRLPASLIQELGLRPGDEVEVRPSRDAAGQVRLDVSRRPSPQEIIEPLRKFSGRLPENYRFDRDEANVR